MFDDDDARIERDYEFFCYQQAGVIVCRSDHPHYLSRGVYETLIVGPHGHMEIQALG